MAARVNIGWRITDPSLTGHGTVIRHRHGCRCLPCRAAWANYCRATRARVKAGTADFQVSAEFARKHLNYLSAHGLGLRAIEECTGISREHLQDIKHGRTRIRQSTEERIMRIHSSALKSAGSWTHAHRSHEQVNAMLAEGWTKAQIARAMGLKSAALKWWGRNRIRVSTQVRLDAVYQHFREELQRAA